MLNIQVSTLTLLLGPPLAFHGKLISLSHRLGFVRHYCDGTRRGNVTEGRPRIASGAIRGQPDPPAGGGLPDARLAERGGGRRARVLATAQPFRHGRRRESARMAEDSEEKSRRGCATQWRPSQRRFRARRCE